ncbi:hypothetical protein JG30_14360 [Bombilactobacillus mellifer]|uniref:Uncharacterized protein n=1 Tax=Bombilactobacillus mellifer TaxID=1218492 RepID=A0A0F4LPJ1_9LACO|nr:hypothetical protein [Bombilactobacillus mellifer]KJY60747.1 hypothetical protein JG30_14360 [Bombilactobacillus mellifer]
MPAFKRYRGQQPNNQQQRAPQMNRQQTSSVQHPSQPVNNAPQENQMFQDVPGYPVQKQAAPEAATAPQNGQPNVNMGFPTNNQQQMVQTPPSTATVPTQQPLQPSFPPDDWENTEQDLKDLDAQRAQMKQQLRSELLQSRSHYNQLIQNKLNYGNQNNDIQLETTKVKQINRTLRAWFGTDQMSGEIVFDSQRKYFILQESFLDQNDSQRGYLANLDYFLDDKTILPAIVSLNYDEELMKHWQTYLDDGIVNPDAVLFNIYRSFQNDEEYETVTAAQKQGLIEISAEARVETDKDNNVDYIYEKNKLIMKVVKNEAGNPLNIYHYHDDRILSIDFIDDQGINMVTQVMDPHDANNVLRESFYRPDHSLAIVKSGVAGEPYIQIFNQANIMIQTFDNEQSFILWWLANKVLDEQSTIIVPVSSPMCRILLKQAQNQFQVIPIVDNWRQETQEISNLLAHPDLLQDGIIVFDTDAQKQIDKLTRGKINVSVIPEAMADDEQA